jgi:putative glutamine amidotransferase
MPAPLLVGIVCYGREKDPQRYTLQFPYIDSARRAGLTIAMLPPGDASVASLVSRFDALIFAGGGDINPTLYHQAPHPMLYGLNDERDQTELALLREALSHNLPMLCICRGMQLLNVALGGTLHQHLPDVLPDGIPHRSDQGAVYHNVSITPQSQLAEACGQPTVHINSYHHQAVDRLGSGLYAVAHASDGLVEAIELRGYPDLLTVQWHPEETSATDPSQQRLFHWLASRIQR